MKRNVLKQTIMSTAASVIRKMSDEEYYGWPPVCIGIMYEPVRPKCEVESDDQTAKAQQ